MCSSKHDTQTANNTLKDHQSQRGNAKPAQPMARSRNQNASVKRNGQQTDEGSHQPMTVLVKNIADHFRPRIKKHVVAKSGRPIRHGKSRAFAGDEAADEKQGKRGAGENDGDSMRPN